MARLERFSRQASTPVPPGARWWRDAWVIARWTRRITLFAMLLFVAAAWSYWGKRWVPPIRTVVIEGGLEHSDTDRLRYAVLRVVEGKHFFDVDLQALRRALEELPWVRHARVHRVWPDALVVTVVEHRAAAIWIDVADGSVALIDTDGHRFEAEPPSTELPRLVGPSGLEERLFETHQSLSRLLDPLGGVEVLVMSPSLSHVVRLSGGTEIILGRFETVQQARQKVSWLVQHWSAIRERLGHEPVRVDFRHHGALALAIAPDGVAASAPPVSTGKKKP